MKEIEKLKVVVATDDLNLFRGMRCPNRCDGPQCRSSAEGEDRGEVRVCIDYFLYSEFSLAEAESPLSFSTMSILGDWCARIVSKTLELSLPSEGERLEAENHSLSFAAKNIAHPVSGKLPLSWMSKRDAALRPRVLVFSH